ncbi:bifunctional UDP-N-acetylglucosamine diphosphorylase/glucosamine-1-phosphate N-acetyltransferase GlmU [Limibaculum sp. M0105]|uniref:Bifunctional protein GlmU n=1 Tax=Thermohalobaculum xanthum TaxID=2753746 RepID=A0A8J7MB64_9RHOB|nr:bifunctional UDP-N-acetylglucosamine diphosphorylase/glucosamine-1-phosphate N-acetyltransferase GlmU [Thermohalobaculum xanthum]MBK0400914.1 bifunctional UDP-N-acetylglucosamine diphosphorylase/glucosamine-1-phosphate N-acetyltransferase GlmU [Thermohalobaculum xanthum]
MSASSPAPRSDPRPVAVIVLAAGKGTRMRSALPKVLHPIAGRPMLGHALAAAATLGPRRVAVVVGHGAEAVGAAAGAVLPEARIFLQSEQKGTAHAVLAARAALEGFAGDALILYGDTPFISAATLARLVAARADADIAVLGFEAEEPGRYGRLVMDADGMLDRIVEAKDATEAELAIRLCNSGVLAADAATLLRLLDRVGCDNAQGEFYLTDVIGLARGEGRACCAVLCDEAETMGINDRAELARAEALWQARARREAMLGGVTMTAPETVFLAWDTVLGRDVTIGPNVVFAPGVSVADGAEIRAFCHLEGAVVGEGAIVGPFARLRPGARIGAGAHVGNFVEIKNASLGAGAKANHLTYVGDALVGAGANLGAGTITCNYDGFDKHRTEIGEGAFIGVNTALIAPVSVGANAYVATGTVITRDVPDEALAIARVPQENREGSGRRLRQTLKARKDARNRKNAGDGKA